MLQQPCPVNIFLKTLSPSRFSSPPAPIFDAAPIFLLFVIFKITLKILKKKFKIKILCIFFVTYQLRKLPCHFWIVEHRYDAHITATISSIIP